MKKLFYCYNAVGDHCGTVHKSCAAAARCAKKARFKGIKQLEAGEFSIIVSTP
jgi:hypothetical protein